MPGTRGTGMWLGSGTPPPGAVLQSPPHGSVPIFIRVCATGGAPCTHPHLHGRVSVSLWEALLAAKCRS